MPDDPQPHRAVWRVDRADGRLYRERCHGCGADADTLYDAGREGVLLCRECRAHPRDYWTKERRDDAR